MLPRPSLGASPQGGQWVLMLGLYFILLAFFILLNAVAAPDQQKGHVAANSLQNEFGPARVPGTAAWRSQAALAPQRLAAMTRLRGQLESMLDWGAQSVTQRGATVIVRLAPQAVWLPRSARLSPVGERVVQTVVGLLAAGPVPQQVQLEVVLQVAQPLGHDGLLATQQTGALAQALMQAGLPVTQALVAVQAGGPELQLHFHVMDTDKSAAMRYSLPQQPKPMTTANDATTAFQPTA